MIRSNLFALIRLHTFCPRADLRLVTAATRGVQEGKLYRASPGTKRGGVVALSLLNLMPSGHPGDRLKL
jgi:hypothetical protein